MPRIPSDHRKLPGTLWVDPRGHLFEATLVNRKDTVVIWLGAPKRIGATTTVLPTCALLSGHSRYTYLGNKKRYNWLNTGAIVSWLGTLYYVQDFDNYGVELENVRQRIFRGESNDFDKALWTRLPNLQRPTPSQLRLIGQWGRAAAKERRRLEEEEERAQEEADRLAEAEAAKAETEQPAPSTWERLR